MSKELDDRLSAAQLRLRIRHPFFATLALFAPVEMTDRVSTAATDGKALFLNKDYLQGLEDPELDGLLIHEVLHMALLHVPRCGNRELQLWNIACDIVVNGMILAEGLTLPKGAVRDKALEALSAEEIYDRLLEKPKKKGVFLEDLLVGVEAGGPADSDRVSTELGAYWTHAREQASLVTDRLIEGGKFQGRNPLGHSREWAVVREPEIDWRTMLWQFMVRTPVDYAGFDRRFIGQGLYLEALEGEAIQVALCVDTSGSVSGEELSQFLSEISGIIRSYPHIRCDLYFADAELFGPYEITDLADIPKPKGGGGTSFGPFFEAVSASDALSQAPAGGFLAIYLTDGFADFPEAPEFPVLWVVTKTGLLAHEFPFGEVARLRV